MGLLSCGIANNSLSNRPTVGMSVPISPGMQLPLRTRKGLDGELGTRDSGFGGRATLKWVSNDWEGADGNKEGKEKRVYKVAAII